MARFEMNMSEVKSILHSPEAFAVLGKKAHQVLSVCEATAPVETGAYRRSFRISGGQTKGGSAIVRVANDDPAAAHIEWGTKHSAFGPTPAHHTMANAMASVIE
ncbi:hypothetical protein O1L55_20705 [Streptomyces albulus]|nr:hypothetical protein [Streptomyces noursei]